MMDIEGNDQVVVEDSDEVVGENIHKECPNMEDQHRGVDPEHWEAFHGALQRRFCDELIEVEEDNSYYNNIRDGPVVGNIRHDPLSNQDVDKC